MKILYLYPFSFQKKKTYSCYVPSCLKCTLESRLWPPAASLVTTRFVFVTLSNKATCRKYINICVSNVARAFFLRTIKFPGSSLTLVQGDISFRRSLYLLKLSNFQKKQLHDCTQASCFFFNLGMQCRTDNSYNEHQTLLSEISISFFTCFKRTTILNNFKLFLWDNFMIILDNSVC